MKTNHTPGPWIAGEVNGSGSHRVFSTNDPNNQLYCAVETGWGVDPRAVAAANARLIAAAPDLLAAMEEAARPGGLSQDEFKRWLPRACAAIAKAKGPQ